MLVFIRHGERADKADPSWTADLNESVDPPLTALGVVQAKAAGTALSTFVSHEIHEIYSSPFTRTVQTAVEIALVTTRRITIDVGVCEMLTTNMFRSVDPLPLLPEPQHESVSFSVCPSDTPRPIHPESKSDYTRRFAEVSERLASKHANDCAVVVSHGGVIQGLLKALVSPTERPKVSGMVRYASISVLERGDEGWRVVVYDNTSFLNPDRLWEKVGVPALTRQQATTLAQLERDNNATGDKRAWLALRDQLKRELTPLQIMYMNHRLKRRPNNK